MLTIYSVSALFMNKDSQNYELLVSKRVFISTGYGPGGMNTGDDNEQNQAANGPSSESDYAQSKASVERLRNEVEWLQKNIKSGKLPKPSSVLIDLLNSKVKELLQIAQQIKSTRGKREIIKIVLSWTVPDWL